MNFTYEILGKVSGSSWSLDLPSLPGKGATVKINNKEYIVKEHVYESGKPVHLQLEPKPSGTVPYVAEM